MTIGTCALVAAPSGPLHAQIRSRPVAAPDYGWWITGGTGALVINPITDGASQTKWNFGTDPVWQPRVTIEKAIDEFTTIGAVVGYGKANIALTSIATGANSHVPSDCQVACDVTAQLWTGLLQFRSGGGEGFHTVFEASAGATVFRDFQTNIQTSAPAAPSVPLAGIRRALDLTGTLGIGFGYSLSRSLAVSLVQDGGIGFHSKTDLPSGTGRSWKMRTTRAALRLKF